jgi:SAM-dependent methyltransferase
MTEILSVQVPSDGQAASRCLACDHAGLALALDLGTQTLANDYLPQPCDSAPRYPLALNHCPACGHGQLSHFVSPERLFGHYLYASGTSQTLLRYFDWFAQACRSVAAEGSRVLEIASNDGSLLQALKAVGFDVLGIDPARNLAHAAQQRGLPTLCDFWPSDQIAPDARFDLVVGQNVLAHTPTPHAFLQVVQRHLSRAGLCLIQTSQAQMLDNGEFDTIYHEHHSFFTPRSMAVLAQRSGLALRAVHQVAIHGNSWLFVLSHPGAPVATNGSWDTPPFGMGALSATDLLVLQGPAPDGATLAQPYAEFRARALARIHAVQVQIAQHQAHGRRICFVGAAAKAVVFMQAAGIVPDAILDEAPLKIGQYIPGMPMPVQAFTDVVDMKGACLFVIAAWNFRAEIEAKIRRLRPSGEDVFLSYFPQVEIS